MPHQIDFSIKDYLCKKIFTGSCENYFGSVGHQNNNSPKVSLSAHLKIKILIIEVKKIVQRLICQFKLKTVQQM